MTRTVKKPDVRRKEIVDAARRLFLEHDYEKTSMNALIQELNIAKGTVYHYFSSKEDLLEAVVDDLIDEDLKRKEELMASAEVRDLDALGKFHALLTMRAIAQGNEPILEELHRPGNTVMHARQLGRYVRMLAPLFASVVRQGCEEGVFTVEHPLEASEFLLAGVQFITDVGFYDWTNDDLSRRMKALGSIVESQLGAPRGSFDFLSSDDSAAGQPGKEN